MRPVPRAVGILALLLYVGTTPIEAATQRDVAGIPKVAPDSVAIGGEYWARLIGMDQYQQPIVAKLQSAVTDTQAVRGLLLQRYGLNRDTIIESTSGPATRKNIEDALTQLRTQAGKDDSVFPDDAGHGQIETKKKQVESATANDMPKQANREMIGKDGAKMLLIPAGDFMMGSTEGLADEEPVHQVLLDAFYLDKYEVTNTLFQKFVHETGYETTAEKEGRAAAVTSDGEWEVIGGANWRNPEGGETVFESNREEHPVVSVSWYDADTYCRWADKRLPTEAEFEYASRAGTRTIYWWGDGNPDSQRAANIADESAKRRFPGLPIMAGYDDGYERSAPVGSFDPNPWGLHDMIGNVSEWTADWYAEDYYRNSPERNPIGPFNGKYKVLRGGSWHNGPLGVRSTYRRNSHPAYRYDHFGYRCAKTP